jgi:hypothetical protein
MTIGAAIKVHEMKTRTIWAVRVCITTTSRAHDYDHVAPSQSSSAVPLDPARIRRLAAESNVAFYTGHGSSFDKSTLWEG